MHFGNSYLSNTPHKKGKSVFLLVFTASEKHSCKGIQARHSQLCLPAFKVVTGPCIYRSLAVASEFSNAAVHLFSSPVHPASSVAALCHPRPHLGAPGSSSLTLVR